MRIVSELEFPISSTMTGALLTIKPGAMRELHWHPNAAEWQFSLAENLRIVFILRDIEGLSIKETADTLALTETNVKTRLLRARMFLRERLSTYYAEHLQEEER